MTCSAFNKHKVRELASLIGIRPKALTAAQAAMSKARKVAKNYRPGYVTLPESAWQELEQALKALEYRQ